MTEKDYNGLIPLMVVHLAHNILACGFVLAGAKNNNNGHIDKAP